VQKDSVPGREIDVADAFLQGLPKPFQNGKLLKPSVKTGAISGVGNAEQRASRQSCNNEQRGYAHV
jgi:hypothetical protein